MPTCLGTLDDKIELNRRMNETLEEMARALFKSWFVDFDPVRAKMDGRWHAPASLSPASLSHLYDLFPDRLVDSERGPIPEGWKVKGAGGVMSAKPQYGYTVVGKGRASWSRSSSESRTSTSCRGWTGVQCHIAKSQCRINYKYQVCYGDILIARMADPGHGILVEASPEAVFASYLIRFRPVSELHARILQYWLKSEDYWELVHSRGAGTTRISLNAKVLCDFPLVVPDDSIAMEFSHLIDSTRSIVVANMAESNTLAAQRDALLPKLVSGEMKLGEVT